MELRTLDTGHIDRLSRALNALRAELGRVERWGTQLAFVLASGGRLLVCGNGGSAAQADHLAGELVGRYVGDRAAYAAIALHAQGAAMTAIANDYGADEAFARQVRAFGRRGDVLLALSTSGESPNVLAAVAAARELGLKTWALTGASPNTLAASCGDSLCVADRYTPTVQEVHLVALHLVCEHFDRALASHAVELAGR